MRFRLVRFDSAGLGQGRGKGVGDLAGADPESCAIFSAHATEESERHDDRPSRTSWSALGGSAFLVGGLNFFVP